MENLIDTIKSNTFVVVDLETTGLNHSLEYGEVDYIIEIGAVKIEKGKITKKFHSFVSCPIALPKEIKDLTGITTADLRGAPSINDALTKLQAFCANSYLVGHNLPFDLGFLNYYGKELGITFNGKTYDTLTLSKSVLAGELSSYKLSAIAKYFDISTRTHKAVNDALATAKIFLALAKHQSFLAWISSVKEFD